MRFRKTVLMPELSDLGADNSVTVTITDGEVQVSRVYNDIIQVLINALNTHRDKVARIATDADNVIVLTGNRLMQK